MDSMPQQNLIQKTVESLSTIIMESMPQNQCIRQEAEPISSTTERMLITLMSMLSFVKLIALLIALSFTKKLLFSCKKILSRAKETILEHSKVREGLSFALFVGGFVISSARRALSKSKRMSLETIMDGLKLKMQTSGLEEEIKFTVNRHLPVNLKLLSSIQSELWKDRFVPKDSQRKSLLKERGEQFWIDAKRYMAYATAAYGQGMIHATKVEVHGDFQPSFRIRNVEAVADHIGVPQEDIPLFDVDYDGDARHLRHFVAIDHENRKVVLSIRGTYCPQDLAVDVCAFTTDFCGGEAHSEMAKMSERLWENAGSTITSLLNENRGYEFIITGHSLGAGTACLLTILIQYKKLVSAPTRCFAYAAPPVFAPLDVVPDLSAITTFVHNHDVVPFLSVFSVRNLMSQLRDIHSFAHYKMSRKSRLRAFLLGSKKRKASMMMHHNEWQPDVALEGAPELQVPAGRTIWLHKKKGGLYDWECFTPEEMLEHYSYVRVHPKMVADHSPYCYESGFEHLSLEDIRASRHQSYSTPGSSDEKKDLKDLGHLSLSTLSTLLDEDYLSEYDESEDEDSDVDDTMPSFYSSLGRRLEKSFYSSLGKRPKEKRESDFMTSIYCDTLNTLLDPSFDYDDEEEDN